MVNATKEISSKALRSGQLGLLRHCKGQKQYCNALENAEGRKKAVITDRHFIKFDCKGNGIRMIIAGSIRMTKVLSSFFFPI